MEIVLEFLQGSYHLYNFVREVYGIIREDPWIGVAIAVLTIAGAIAAIWIRKFGKDEFLKIPKVT